MNIKLYPKNAVFYEVDCYPDIAAEIAEHLSVQLKNYYHMPAYKKSKGKWDGTIQLFSSYRKNLYRGHLGHLASFCKKKGYKLDLSELPLDYIPFTEKYLLGLLKKHKCNLVPRDYQIEAALKALRSRTITIESPTASGKSFIIYMICLALLESQHAKSCIIVPTTSLVEQIYKDFADYGFDVVENCARLYAGKEKNPKQPIIISTWQSLFRMDTSYFHQFNCIIGDEAHGYDSKSLKHILENAINAFWRVGTTGTFPTDRSKRLLIEGLFGPVYKAETTDGLIKKGFINEMKPIQIKYLNYPKEEIAKLSGKYQDEISYLISNEKRNKYIIDLCEKCEGNTLVLFSRVETHGVPLYEMAKSQIKNRKIFFVAGKTKTEDREKVREIVNQEKDAIIFASSGVFSTGINIPSLSNLILTTPTKGLIKLLQSIGRILRLSNWISTVYDLVDDLKQGEIDNYAIQHASERLKIYAKQKFKIEYEKVNLYG